MAISRAGMGNEIKTAPSSKPKKVFGNRFNNTGAPKLNPKLKGFMGKGRGK